MKAAIISINHPESTLPLAAHLALDQNIEVDLFYIMSFRNKAHPIFEFGNKKFFVGLNLITTTNSIKEFYPYLNIQRLKIYILFYPIISVNYFFLSDVFTPFFLNIINRKSYDLFHLIGQNPLFFKYHLLLKDKKVVHSFHEAAPHFIGQSEITLVDYVINNNIQIILHSENVYSLLRKKRKVNSDLIDIIPFGKFESYNLFQKKNNGESSRFKYKILWFGRITPYKGIEIFIEAAEILAKKRNDIEFIIAGRGGEEILEKICKKDQFRIINRHLSSWELADLVSESSVVVCTHSSASQSGIPMTAFAFNKPVISSDVSGINHLVVHDKNGLLFKPGDSWSLSECIDRYVSESSLQAKLINGVRKTTNEGVFSWKEISKSTHLKYLKTIK